MVPVTVRVRVVPVVRLDECSRVEVLEVWVHWVLKVMNSVL